MNIEIKKSLSVSELGDPARITEMQEKDIKLVDLSCEKRLELLLETLIQEPENRLINRLIRNACFKYPSAGLESLDYDSGQIKKSMILNLATMGFAANATNPVITGPAGAGKTCLACALGVEACRQTYRVLYIRQADSIMDRIIHNAYEIPANETNLRKLYDSKKLKKPVDEIES